MLAVLLGPLLGGYASVSAGGLAVMPKELLGTWQYGHAPCSASVFGESDTAIRVESSKILGYEHRDTIKTVERISTSPSAWRILRVSDVAPAEVQDQPEIFVRNGERMTITDGVTARTYTLCK